jgi:hypothetical protein
MPDGSDLGMLLDPEAWKTKSQNLAHRTIASPTGQSLLSQRRCSNKIRPTFSLKASLNNKCLDSYFLGVDFVVPLAMEFISLD